MAAGERGGGGRGAVRGQRSSHPRVTTAHLSVLSKKLNLTFSFRFVLSSPSRMRTETLPRRSTRRVSSPSAVRDGLGGRGGLDCPCCRVQHIHTTRAHVWFGGREARGERRERERLLPWAVYSIHPFAKRERGGEGGVTTFGRASQPWVPRHAMRESLSSPSSHNVCA